jgi:NAD(P) transhydrogenase subunit alpha
MKIGVLNESRDGETRVALIPDIAGRLIKSGHEILVESGAGERASYDDDAFRSAGATITSADDVLQQSAVVVRVQIPTPEEIQACRAGSVLVGFLSPLNNPALVQALAQQKVTGFSMELVPRITRAQAMDALSSMSTVAGYQAALRSALTLPKFFPMLVTAAGTLAPAKALILGAGVAGLQAIASCRRLGAITSAFDVRPAVKEQVQSLGAKFLELEAPMEDAEDAGGYAKELSQDAEKRVEELVAGAVKGNDVVITTALIPGKPAPTLITEDMVRSMRPGSVIIDLAAEAGGNCTLTQAGETIQAHGVTIMGPLNLPASMPVHASQMYAKNVQAVLQHLSPEGELKLDFEDEITAGSTVTHNGEIVHERVRGLMQAAGGGA